MFEFHGWFVIRVPDYDDPPLEVQYARMVEAETAVKTALKQSDDGFSCFEIQRAGNNLRVVTVNGLRNHRYQPVIDLFQWAADNLHEAYGLLYVWDDEDKTDERGDLSNCFRVWRLAQGMLTEEADPFLSPCIPTIERPLPNTIASVTVASLTNEQAKEIEELVGIRPVLGMRPRNLEKVLGPPHKVFQITPGRNEYHYILDSEPQRRARFLFDDSGLLFVWVEEPAFP